MLTSILPDHYYHCYYLVVTAVFAHLQWHFVCLSLKLGRAETGDVHGCVQL